MKRFLFVIFMILIIHSILFATVFNKIYHKDYGEVDRIVLVFNEKPDFNIIENNANIQIEILNCTKAVNIKDQSIDDSNILKNFTFYQYDNNLIITIALDQEFFLLKGSEYNLEKLELPGEIYKLVLDIFSTSEPKTIKEHEGFADFFNSVGFSKRAKFHLQEAEKLKTQNLSSKKQTPPPVDRDLQKTEKTDEDQPKKDIPKTKKKNFFKSILESLRKLDTTISIIILLILIIIIIILIVILNKKTSGSKTTKIGYRTTEGFGDEEFRKKMVLKLAESGWKNEAIAKELNIKTEEVNKILKST